MNLVERTCAKVLETTPGLTGRDLRAAAYHYMADYCEAVMREDAAVPSGKVAVYSYREMARRIRAGGIP